jgi:hypothetical protein
MQRRQALVVANLLFHLGGDDGCLRKASSPMDDSQSDTFNAGAADVLFFLQPGEDICSGLGVVLGLNLLGVGNFFSLQDGQAWLFSDAFHGQAEQLAAFKSVLLRGRAGDELDLEGIAARIHYQHIHD